MGSTGEGSALFRGSLGHACVHGLRPAPDGNAGLFEVAANDEPLRSVFGGERLLGHSLHIEASDLIHRKNNLGGFVGEPGGANDLTNSSRPTTDLASDLHNALPSGVLLDNVISVNRRSFAGHVYNLQTSEGWYIANNIISHNCRCICTPIGYYTPERYKRQSGADWFAQQPEAVQRAMMPSQAAYDAYKRGDIQLSDFLGEKHSDVWGTTVYQRSGKEAMKRAK